MRFKLFILVLFVFVNKANMYSQDTLTSGDVEQQSYQLYLDKNWSELIDFANTSISKGFDYYYLRLRLGIAYYENKNYVAALPHFKQALTFNSEDELCLEYIYYCYIYTARYDEARWFSKQLSETLKEKIGILNQQSVALVSIEAGTKITDKKTYPSNDPNNVDGNYFNPPAYAQLGLCHYIKNRFSLFHAVTYFSQQSFVNKVNQYQYYLKAAIPLKNNFSISTSLHAININIFDEKTFSTTDTLWPPGVPPHSQPPPGAPPFKTATTYTTISNSSSNSYFVANFFVQKHMKNLLAGIGFTGSNMFDKTQFINTGYLAYSPFGNSKLIVGCTGYVHTTDSYKTSYMAMSPFIYIQPTTKLGIKLNYFNNTANNIIEENGYIINNSPDITYSRYSSLINLSINKHVTVYGLYQLEFKKENVQQFDYKYNVILAGIKIIP